MLYLQAFSQFYVKSHEIRGLHKICNLLLFYEIRGLHIEVISGDYLQSIFTKNSQCP